MRAESPGMGRARNKDAQEISATKSWTPFLKVRIVSILDHERQDIPDRCPVGFSL